MKRIQELAEELPLLKCSYCRDNYGREVPLGAISPKGFIAVLKNRRDSGKRAYTIISLLPGTEIACSECLQSVFVWSAKTASIYGGTCG